MKTPQINTAKKVVPMLYAYTTPEIARHNGWTKIGYTEQDVETRINQQTHTADIAWHLEWQGTAMFDDGSGDVFTDKDFHAYLRKQKVEQEAGKNNEWFHITGGESKIKFYDFRQDRGILEKNDVVIPYELRAEQKEAVEKTIAYMQSHANGEFLWNCKPRFGKTLTVYDFVKRIGAKSVLVVTNRLAIANSWFDDYKKFLGTESGYYFVSEVDTLQKRTGVLSRDEYIENILDSLTFEEGEKEPRFIEFVSLQNLKGSTSFGGKYEKLDYIAENNWDLLVVDEAHEGVDTYKTDIAFDKIKRNFILHLSGTPFKALANEKFPSEAIFNYTYVDEQLRKRDWSDDTVNNPYKNLPQLNLFTYQMSEMIHEKLRKGIEIDGENTEFYFDLNEFFKTNENGRFENEKSVDKFLDTLVLGEKYPFSTEELRDELKHTFWLLDRVDSAKALAKKLHSHPVFCDYEIILAAGNGKLDDDEETQKSFDKVVDAISRCDKTITLSVGQLTTGVTIPEWSAVLMLCNVKSPALYMQAAFRAQNPCLFNDGKVQKRKENAYVFDFDPARTLIIFEEFANDLCSDTSGGRGDSEKRNKNITELLNFFPVIGEDDEGELIQLNAEKVLSIPRKIRSKEVVRRGFMCNYLFQNISNLFNAPKEVIDAIEKFDKVKDKKPKSDLKQELAQNLQFNEDGELEIEEEYLKSISTNLPLDEFKRTVTYTIEAKSPYDIVPLSDESKLAKSIKDVVNTEITDTILSAVEEKYGEDLKKSDKKRIQSNISHESERKINKIVGNFSIEKKRLEKERTEALRERFDTGKTTEEINLEFDEKEECIEANLKQKVNDAVGELIDSSAKNAIEVAEYGIQNRKKKTAEDDVRDHLRGFARTIPSFLMAYGDDNVTLENFDDTIPPDVFEKVTGITIDMFRFLRDGGPYNDEETGEEKWFEGKLFDPIVFNDSVKEFLSLRKRLANYFDESNEEDIFDYIPPQKTNQIFTPKRVVKKMVDLLEEENPGCFDQSDKTFADLYMKSGLYIAEIVKRLYQSDTIKQEFPDKTERLQHIFEKQVYGLAPTEIIYKIATNFILGFDDEISIPKHNFRMLNAIPYVKEGTLEEKLDEVFSVQSSTVSSVFDKGKLKVGLKISDKTYGLGEVLDFSQSTVTIQFESEEQPRKLSLWSLKHSSAEII